MELSNKNFVLFRLPNSDNFELWLLNNDFNSNEKFIFKSFNNQRNKELYLTKKFKLKNEEVLNLIFDFELKNDAFFPEEICKETYLKKADLFITALKNKLFDKLILSRVKSANRIDNLNEKLVDLSNKYPSAFVYLFHYESETWLGASPERLLSSDKNGLKTVALAGTKSKAENREWTKKEYLEHNFVVDYITENFKANAVKKSETYTIDLGEIQHLKTDIHITDASLDTNQLLNQLHPTPAVCGVPKEKAKDFILQHEGYNRSFYTGYFGIISEEKTEIYVNLRCAQLFENKTAIYVGGGLIAESNAQAEWEETELKAKALL